MSSPTSIMRPLDQASGVTSCILFKQRMNVDFPHPDGPIMAVTVFSLNEIDMSSKTFFRANPALRLVTCIFSFKLDITMALLSASGVLPNSVKSSELMISYRPSVTVMIE